MARRLLVSAPFRAAERVKMHLAGAAEVAADFVGLQKRHVKQLAVLVFEGEDFPDDSPRIQCLEAAEDADAVVEMDGVIAVVEVGQRKLRDPDRFRFDFGGGLFFERLFEFEFVRVVRVAAGDQLPFGDDQQFFFRQGETAPESCRIAGESGRIEPHAAAVGPQRGEILPVGRDQHDLITGFERPAQVVLQQLPGHPAGAFARFRREYAAAVRFR